MPMKSLKESIREKLSYNEHISMAMTHPVEEDGSFVIKAGLRYSVDEAKELGFTSPHKMAQSLDLPDRIEGIKVVYSFEGRFEFCSTTKHDPLIGGIEVVIGEPDPDPVLGGYFAGTLAGVCWDKDTAQKYMLGCAHIFTTEQFENGIYGVGTRIHQPAYLADEYLAGYVTQWGWEREGLDAAIASLERNFDDYNYYQYGEATPTKLVEPAVGTEVFKVGKSTGYTSGAQVTGYADVTIDYTVGDLDESMTVKDALMINKGSWDDFVDSGDSGSMVFRASDDGLMSLLFAMTSSQTATIPLRRIEEAFNVTFNQIHEIEEHPIASLYLTNTNADIAAGEFSKYIRIDPTATAIVDIALDRDVPKYGYGYSYPDEIDLRAGSGPIEVNVVVTTANSGVDCSVRASRTDSNGSIISSTNWTDSQALASAITYTFTTETVDWTAANETDRLLIEYRFLTGAHSASFSIRLGNAPVVVPFVRELEIYVAEGVGFVDPAPGIYKTPAKYVNIEASTFGIGWLFDKWAINAVNDTENVKTLTMDQNKTVAAYFVEAAQYTLTVTVEEGLGTVTPAAGAHTYYEGEPITFEGVPDTDIHNTIWDIDGVVYRGRTVTIDMPPKDITAKVRFVEPYVLVERKTGEAGAWEFLAEVVEPDTENPANYDDQTGLEDGVTYWYRVRRYEYNDHSTWSNEVSVLYVWEEPVGDTTISATVAGINANGLVPMITGQKTVVIQAVTGEIDSLGVIPVITAEEIVDAIISAVAGSINIQGYDPVVSTQEFATVQSTVGEVGVDAVPPNVVATQMAHIINLPPPVNEFEGLAPTIVSEELGDIEIYPDPGQTEIQGLAPDISVTENVSIPSETSESNFEGLAPSVSTTQSSSVQATCGEISARGKLPSFQTTKNAHVDSAVGLIDAEGLASTITSTIGAPVLTASQPNGYIYVEWEVV